MTENPYATPRSLTTFIPSTQPRSLNLGQIAVAGAVMGVTSYMAAIALIPAEIATPGEHDLRLANHLGFIYPPLVGLWAAWIRRSLPWAGFGIASGLLIGAFYYLMCGYDFLAVMVGFPCILGGVTSVLMGTKAGSWTDGVVARFSKGLVAGVVLGFTYMVVLNLVGMIIDVNSILLQSTAAYIAMMWRAGPIAMGVASGLYLMLFHWSAGLNADLLNANSNGHADAIDSVDGSSESS